MAAPMMMAGFPNRIIAHFNLHDGMWKSSECGFVTSKISLIAEAVAGYPADPEVVAQLQH
jgi:hypothetical protein